MRVVIANLLACMMFSAVTNAQSSRPTTKPDGGGEAPTRVGENDAPKSPAAAYGKLLTLLTEEGERAAKERALPRAHADIASAYPHALPMARLGRAIIERQHRDDLVDAYIRWQLTSFDPPLPKLTQRQFERVLANLPALTTNPRADEDLVRLLNRAINTGELIEHDQQRINERIEQMNAEQSQRRALNTAGLELRGWIAEQYPDTIAHRIMVAVETCAALARAGWRTGSYGATAEELFDEASRDRDFDAASKRRLTAFTRQFAGIERVYIRSARINENRIEVNFANTAIYDFDVRRWLRRMEGK